MALDGECYIHTHMETAIKHKNGKQTTTKHINNKNNNNNNNKE